MCVVLAILIQNFTFHVPPPRDIPPPVATRTRFRHAPRVVIGESQVSAQPIDACRIGTGLQDRLLTEAFFRDLQKSGKGCAPTFMKDTIRVVIKENIFTHLRRRRSDCPSHIFEQCPLPTYNNCPMEQDQVWRGSCTTVQSVEM